jgi:hypothetical protein
VFRCDGSYPPTLGLAFLHSTTVGVPDEAGESSDEASERSNRVVDPDDASVGMAVLTTFLAALAKPT